jgi:plastocyanin
MPLANRWTALAAAALLISASGCKKPQSTSSGQPGTAAPTATIDWNTAATLSGTIHYAKKAPPRVQIDMAQDPACSLAGDNYSEQILSDGGKLANVYIYVKDGLGNKIYAASTTPVVLDQKGCRYVPHVIAVQAGQPVHFTNSDSTMHNVHMMPEIAGNPSVDISQPPRGGDTTRVFSHSENMIQVRCTNHPWMQAFINVAASPFFAVSDDKGHFEIRGLPPGTYTIEAVHEELGTKTATVTVSAKQAATQDFTFGD